MKKQILLSLGILSIIVTIAVGIIIYGKGYQIDFIKGKPEISGTGLLVATSTPDGALVTINGHPTTATNNTINLAPGMYKIAITKDRYFPWIKTIIIKKEIVAKAEALLFLMNPKLESITDIGVSQPVVDPSGEKIAFTVSSQSTQKNGIYIFNMASGPLPTLQSAQTQLTDDTTDQFSKAKISWSPDSQSILASVSAGTTYLLSANSFTPTPQDVTETLSAVQATWVKEKQDKAAAQIAHLTPLLKQLVIQNFTIVSWSADETKFMYVASQSATLPYVINPPLSSSDSTPQTRTIQQGGIYVYDSKEDKNFKLLDSLANTDDIIENNVFPFRWFADSKHLLYIHNKKIDVMDYDGVNKTTIYAGPFDDTYGFPWPTGGKFVILTNLGNDAISPNLYTVSLQ